MQGSPGDESAAPVAVTEAARSYLAAQLELVAEGDTCFRLSRDSDRRMSTTVTEPAPEDVLVQHDGKTVLAIEQDLARGLQGNTIDIEKTDEGLGALIVL